MPDPTLTEAYKEAIAQCKSDVRIYETLEVLSGISSTEVKNIDVAFVLDVSGSMGSQIIWLKTALPELFNDLLERFSGVRMALISYGQTAGSGNPILQNPFTPDPTPLVESLDTLVASGAREPVFDSLAMALDSLSWTGRYGTSKAIVLITDEAGQESGQEHDEAYVTSGLVDESITLHQTFRTATNNTPIVRMMLATDGQYIRTNNSANFKADTVEALLTVHVVDPALEPIYMVNAPEPKEFRLETGELVTFRPVGFSLTLPDQNDQGVSELSLSVDNIDQTAANFVFEAEKYDAPIIIRRRAYLSNDPNTPANNPPLELVLKDVEVTQLYVKGRAAFQDIVNMKFLSETYNGYRFPSIGLSG